MENDPELAKKNLEQLSIMLRGALAEMRTMLIELRPAALVGKPLSELIQLLVDANQAKLNCPLKVAVDGDHIFPEEVTIAYYRIAQEAINNIIKHSDADRASISVVSDAEGVVMTVKDTGRGFATEKIPPGYFGVHIMAERMEEIGGALTIESKPGYGTQVIASWSEGSEEAYNA